MMNASLLRRKADRGQAGPEWNGHPTTMHNSEQSHRSRYFGAISLLALATMLTTACTSNGSGLGLYRTEEATVPKAPERVEPWTTGQLIEPGDLAGIVARQSSERPLILYVGPRVLYRKAHIPGAQFIGPAGEPDGLHALQQAVQSVAKDADVVIYCGCCPWNVCPNVRPAFVKLQQMGFSRVRVLHLPNNLSQNWVGKGYPVEAGGL